MLEVSHAERVVFPEVGKTKADVVAYYDRIAVRALPHLVGRPLSLRRYPKGLAGAGFFQKNVPDHYPPSIERHAIPRSTQATKKHRDPEQQAREFTVYPILHEPAHLPYVANQGAIELHVPTARAPHHVADRLVIDLDPPPDGLSLVRRAALFMRDALEAFGLPTVPVATGSKGYHLVAAIRPTVEPDALVTAIRQFASLAVAKHPDDLTLAFRVKNRGQRVFVDWLRNVPMATVVAPYSLRAKPRATVAAPLSWEELESHAPDAFTMDDVDRMLDRRDTLADLDTRPADGAAFVAAVEVAFQSSGLTLETFDRFRS